MRSDPDAGLLFAVRRLREFVRAEEQPLLGTPPNAIGHRNTWRNAKNAEELDTFRATKEKESFTQLRQRTAECLMAAFDAQRQGDRPDRRIGPRTQIASGHGPALGEPLETWNNKPPDLHSLVRLRKVATNEFEPRPPELAMQWAVGQTSTNNLNPSWRSRLRESLRRP